MYPDDCVQSISPTDWWAENKEKTLRRGALVFAFVPYIDQVPYTFEPLGRQEAERHDNAKVQVAPLRINQPLKETELPVAAMPLHKAEVWAAYRAKKRPCLVIGSISPFISRSHTKGMAKHSTAQTILAAPYYGATQDGRRGGYNPQFVERIRHCEYPQFFWDKLPISGPEESIVRLDHIQPIGTHHNSYKLSEHRLSDDALLIIDELLQWLIKGKVHEDSLIASYRKDIESTFGAVPARAGIDPKR